MKKGIHPDYHTVVYLDISSGFKFLSRSTSVSKETIEWEDGNTYPLLKVDVSSESHPFYTGSKNSVNMRAGRVERFQKRYGNADKSDKAAN
jgi:large subunit ribosomal protein L31